MSEENTAQNTESTTEVTETQGTQEQGNTQSEKTFTQSEVNALLADQKRKVQSKHADYDELKTTVSNLDVIKNEAFENGKSTATTDLLGKLIETEIRANAESLGFADASDALTFFGDKDSVTYDPETGVNREAIVNRLSEVAEQKPYLLKSEQGTRAQSNLFPPKPKTGAPVNTPAEEKPSSKVAAALRNLSKTTL